MFDKLPTSYRLIRAHSQIFIFSWPHCWFIRTMVHSNVWVEAALLSFALFFSRTQRQANDSHFRSWKLQKRENLKIDLVGALTMACNLMKPNKKPNKILNDFCSLKRPISDFKPKVNLRCISPKTLLSFLQKLSWHLNLSSRFSPQFATSYSKPYSEQRVWV